MIVITAPTGDIGRQVLDRIVESSEEVRVIVRDPAKMPASAHDCIEIIEGSHGDGDVLDRALAGADSLFWLAPPDPKASSVEEAYVGFTHPAAAAIRQHKVGRVVVITALGRGTPQSSDAGYVTASLQMDALLAEATPNLREIANPSFMDNIARQAASIRAKGMFFGPIDGDRKLPTAATKDIAAVAAALLLDTRGAAAIMSRCSDRKISRSTIWRASCPTC